MLALLVGRFHALTRAQAEFLSSLRNAGEIDRVVCVVTSADHAGTRRNPLDADTREALLRPALAASGRPFDLVRVADIPDDAAWVEHVCAAVGAQLGVRPTPAGAVVYTTNRAVDALFAAAGFRIVSPPSDALTPSELIERAARGEPWQALAAPSTVEVYEQRGVPARLLHIFAEQRRNEDGELAAHRDFQTYGAEMDASLRQKVDDLLPWVRPGRIVDKGCGTGKLLCELTRRFPDSSFVGVDLSRELLRRCDELTYAAGDVTLQLGEAAALQVAQGSATTVILSSVMHEIYTYSGYDLGEVDRALASAAAELGAGGRVLLRDGVSPPDAVWRLQLLDAATAERFARFAVEFKHGRGAPHERIAVDRVELASHLGNEFLCKKDYLANWAIEVNEEYGVRTTDGWRDALERAGFAVVHLVAYVNPWIAEHRYRGKVALTDGADCPLPWPATNFVAVGEKRA
jgi:SAM-dependent methyltransferase